MKVKHILFRTFIFIIRMECAFRFFFLFLLLRELCFSKNILNSTELLLSLCIAVVPISVAVFSMIFINETFFLLGVLWSSFFVAPYLIGFSAYELVLKRGGECVNLNRRRITDLFAYWIILAGCIFFNGFFYLGRPIGEWCLLLLSSFVGALFFSFGWGYLSSAFCRIIYRLKNVL